MDALALANPLFHDLIAGKVKSGGSLNVKERLSLSKYYNRSCFRPTPFGGFSSFTVARWGDSEQLTIADIGEVQMHIRPDQELVMALDEHRVANAADDWYLINPLFYETDQEFRYIRSIKAEPAPKLSFTIESLEATRLNRKLVKLLRSGPRTGNELLRCIAGQSYCNAEDAALYLGALRSAQVIQPLMSCNITGEDYFIRLVKSGSLVNKTQGLIELQAIFSRTYPLGALPLVAIQRAVEVQVGGEVTGQPLRQVYGIAERPLAGGDVPIRLQEKIRQALRCLAVLAQPECMSPMSEFRLRFEERFEGRKIPLLQALDPDAGIGYGRLTSPTGSALLEGLPFPEQKASGALSWTAVHRLLLHKWLGNEAGGRVQHIALCAEDLAVCTRDEALAFPPGISVLFRIIDNDTLFIETAGGVSAHPLIGRFTPFSSEIDALARDLAAREAAANPSVLFAEIAQLSDFHADNINRRLTVLDYEIPVNCVSLLPPDRQILPQDLLVSVEGGRVVLESGRLMREVIPRMSSAYNYNRNELAIFRFLCDLQYQGLQSNLTLDLRHFFPGMNYYPRVTFEDTIISPAKWFPGIEAVREMIRGGTTGFPAYKSKLQLPRRIALSSNDRQLVFDLDVPAEVSLLLQCIKDLEQVQLNEFFCPVVTGSPVTDSQGNPYSGQFHTFLFNKATVYSAVSQQSTSAGGNTRRNFVPGSQWLYFKIYCSAQVAHDILRYRLPGLLRKLTKSGPFCWFFIRYDDPGPHLRVRICVNQERNAEVIRLFKTIFGALDDNDMIRDYSANTYRRELERYGSDIIELVEEFFCASSALCLQMIRSTGDEYTATQHLFALVSTMEILDRLLPEDTAQIRFLRSVSQSLFAEHLGTKHFRVALDSKYRIVKSELLGVLQDTKYFVRLKTSSGHKRFKGSVMAIQRQMKLFQEQRKIALCADIIHMHLNRVFTDQQRKQELVLYYCLHKYKSAEKARMARAKTES